MADTQSVIGTKNKKGQKCINCGACIPECPNEAIFETRGESFSA